MKGTIAYFNADGSCRIETADQPPTLEQLQQAVGGYIEVVNVIYQDRVCQMIVNEEGLMKCLPRNQVATDIYLEAMRRQFPGVANPFKAARDAARKQWEERGVPVFSSEPGGYEDDPYIAGNAVVLDGIELD